MRTRGRTSFAALSVVQSNDTEAIRRPDPPPELTDEQAEEWRAVVERLPADWFPRETHGLLSAYCRHAVSIRRVAELIDAEQGSEEFDVRNYERLLRMQAREGAAMASLATKMRISQQTTYDKSRKKGFTDSKRLWQSSSDK